MPRPDFAPFAARMRAAGQPDIAIRNLAFYYDQLVRGETGLVLESEIRPAVGVADAEALPAAWSVEVGQRALSRTVVIQLNGGLGTSMGLERAKSLLVVRDGLSFLDIIARQTQALGVPVVFMNSFGTRNDTLERLRRYPALRGPHGVPLDFLQHKVPKIDAASLAPIDWASEPELEWCPPGHGDIYPALVSSGMLDGLLDAGYEYAFVSNVDNLGAVIDPVILGYFAGNHLPFLMEVADRTPMDRKGGHLAQRPDGQFVLRESAQCPDEDRHAFQHIERHRYFNTNNLWLDLPALQRLMTTKEGIPGLPMIRNRKTVDPRDPASPAVYQLETAMGAAISLFEGAGALRVPRSRFAPVKTTADLLAVRSDAYLLGGDWRVTPNPRRTLGPLQVELDPAHYRLIDDLDARFPAGAPSLLDCARLSVQGDVRFGRRVVCRGDVRIVNRSGDQLQIPDGAVINEG